MSNKKNRKNKRRNTYRHVFIKRKLYQEGKNTEAAKESRRRSNAQTDNTAAARSAYSRHDNGITPEEVIDDVPPEYLEQLKTSFYSTKVFVTKDEAMEIEKQTKRSGG